MKAYNIVWDTSDINDCDALPYLPNEIIIPDYINPDDEDAISDYISDCTGFCHCGFELGMTDKTSIYDMVKVGDIYHNNNGCNYIILAMDREKDKMILMRKLKDGATFIGAHYVGKNDWGYGHYFMESLAAAVNWFEKD